MEFTQVASFDNYLLANMTLGFLQQHEINCHLKDENIVTIDPLLNPAVGGIKLMVDPAQAEAAKQYMTDAENAYLEDVSCRICGHNAIRVEMMTDAPEDFWGKLKNMIAYGQTEINIKKYRCANCKKLYDEIPSSLAS